jgi:hypothetical protein
MESLTTTTKKKKKKKKKEKEREQTPEEHAQCMTRQSQCDFLARARPPWQALGPFPHVGDPT